MIDHNLSNLNKKTIQWIKQFPDQIINGKNLKEYLTYKGISLWWLAEFYLFSTGVYYPGWQDILLNYELNNKSDYNSGNKLKRNGIFFYKLFRNILRKFCWSFISFFDFKKRDGEKILIFTESQWGPVPGKNKIGDIRFDNILASLEEKKKFSVTIVDNPIGSKLRLKFFLKRLNRYAKHPPLEHYIYLTDFFKTFADLIKLRRKYSKIKNLIDYNYKGVNFSQLFKPKFDFFFNQYVYETILFFNGIERIIKKEKPRLLLISSEINPFQRIAIALGHKKKIKSVSIQHGAVSYESESVNRKSDISKNGDSTAPFLPLPDYQCVYGEFYKNFFLKYGGYNSNNLIITGNSKYDSVIKTSNSFNKDSLKKKLGLNQNKKIILFLSVPFNDPFYRYNFLNKVYNSFKTIKEYSVIVKLHPNEFDSIIHKKIISKKNLTNVTFKDEDIFELGLCSDVIVTGNSTTVMDMAIINKPVIIFDPSKNDICCLEYKKAKAGILVHNSSELYSSLIRLLNKGHFLTNQKFIDNYLYSLDGNASKRIVNLIERIITNLK